MTLRWSVATIPLLALGIGSGVVAASAAALGNPAPTRDVRTAFLAATAMARGIGF